MRSRGQVSGIRKGCSNEQPLASLSGHLNSGVSPEQHDPAAKQGGNVKSYVFRVILEPDEDAWRAYIPDLEEKGGATWGRTKEEALENIREVAQMVIESMLEDGEPLPPRVTEMNEPVVAVMV